jgi:hypothetical protein
MDGVRIEVIVRSRTAAPRPNCLRIGVLPKPFLCRRPPPFAVVLFSAFRFSGGWAPSLRIPRRSPVQEAFFTFFSKTSCGFLNHPFNSASHFPALWRYAHRGSGEGLVSATPDTEDPEASPEHGKTGKVTRKRKTRLPYSARVIASAPLRRRWLIPNRGGELSKVSRTRMAR